MSLNIQKYIYSPNLPICPFSDTNNINERLQDIHNNQSLKLREKQRKKFFRDGINPNKNMPSELSVTSGETTRRKRRFSRHKEINRDQNDRVVNLSSKDLKSAEIRILSKGLNFCPTPNKINEEQLSADGSSDSEDDNDIPLPMFKKKSSWIPKPSKNTTLESFIDLVKNDVQTATSTNIPTHNNLTPAEKGALQELKERDDIVIKSADKGSAVVVMDKVDYLEEANRQLTDERFYKQLDSDPTEEFSTKITQELKIMKENSHIDKNTFDYLKPDKPKVGRFYLLPKIHKVNNPGRPIVSANGHPTEKISEFVDFHLRPHVEALPSHLKDTTDYLQKMESMNPLPSGTILVSMDVTSLYTTQSAKWRWSNVG